MKLFVKIIAAALLWGLLLGTPVHAADKAVEPGTVNAKAVVVMEAYTGRILFAQNEHEQLPIASTTKIMTALLALEQTDIDAMFQVDGDAIRVEGSSMGLQEGDSASLRALATGMLLASGNDGANAAAVRIAGTIPAFAEQMNRRAAQIGMEHTSFATPSGLDAADHYSTAYDMALLTREALRNEQFRDICSQYKMRATYGDPPYERWLTNHNKLLNSYEGCIGVKTGFTKKAGRCLVTAATRNGVTLICVTLSCPDDWNVHATLYDSLFDAVQVEDLARGLGDICIPVTGGTLPEVAAVPYEQAQIPVPAGAAVEYRLTAPRFLYAPITAGQYLGEVGIYLDGQPVAALTLIADRDVPLLHPYVETESLWEKITGL
ncbi:D-alanyl-D-alanine carboxypeptidase, partial [Ruminococcaceae bacterium OttesenSCG-928-L11]|nr:D-alanyl-D-alanine carboxypeptidase [Ruminococcaceae bacterium OttesenSCG-928-L11]